MCEGCACRSACITVDAFNTMWLLWRSLCLLQEVLEEAEEGEEEEEEE